MKYEGRRMNDEGYFLKLHPSSFILHPSSFVSVCVSHVRRMSIDYLPALRDRCLQFSFQPTYYGPYSFTISQIGKDERKFAAHALRVSFHDFKRRIDVPGQVDLIDYQ